METGWKHQSHEIQRELERIRRNASSPQPTTGDVGSATGGAAQTQPTPAPDVIKVKGAINNEIASQGIYDGFRLKSPKDTINVGKITNAPDRLYNFLVDRPLTVEHNDLPVIDQTVPTNYSDTVKYINFKDVTPQTGISHTVTKHKETGIQIQQKYYSYNTAWDNPSFANNLNYATIASGAWQTLCWHNENIPDVQNWVYDVPTDAIPFYFTHEEPDDSVFLITVRLFCVSRHPTNNTAAASIHYPQIALFIDNNHYRTIDVDVRVNEYAVLRQALLDASLISGSVVPESGSKAFLEGTALVRLQKSVHKLNVRFRHETGDTRYVVLLEGSIDITKTGIMIPTPFAQQLPISYNQI